MYYEDSVLDAANDKGQLSQADAKRLIRYHGLEPLDAWMELGDDALDAQALLHWLGY